MSGANGLKTVGVLGSMSLDLASAAAGKDSLAPSQDPSAPSKDPSEDSGFLEGSLEAITDPQIPLLEPGLWSTVFSVAGALVFVLAIFYALTYMVRKLGLRQGWMAPQSKGIIKVLASQRLDVRRSVSIVEIKDRILVLGLGAQEISILDVLDDPKEVEALRKEVEGDTVPEVFQKSLSAAFDKKVRGEQVKTGRDSIMKARKMLDRVLSRVTPGEKS